MVTSIFQPSVDNPKDDATPKNENLKGEDTDDELEDIGLYYKASNRNLNRKSPTQNLLPDTKL
jgi:hypothetical protein